MALFNFFKHYSAAKAESMEESAINLAAELDKDGVAQAAIRQKMEQHEQQVALVAEARKEFEKEKKEWLDEQARHEQLMGAAERAQAALTENPNDKEAEQALAELLDAIEQHLPTLNREKQESDDAEGHLKIMEEAMQEMATELKDLHRTVEDAKRELKAAEVEEERSRKQRERAEVAAKLKKSGNKFDTALNALKNAAEQKRVEADKNRMIADNLAVKKPETSSAASRFMNEASSGAKSSETLQERLAGLKK